MVNTSQEEPNVSAESDAEYFIDTAFALTFVGRTVHYMARGSADGVFPPICRAAIITSPPTDIRELSLCVLNPAGLFFEVVRFDPAGGPGSWHWPEQVQNA